MTAPIRCESVDELLMTMTAICYALCQLYGSSIPDWEKCAFSAAIKTVMKRLTLRLPLI